MFEIKDKDLAGRIGKLRTRKGSLETPTLFPVIDILRQEVNLQDIVSVGFNAVITNAYLYYKRVREKKLELKPVHQLLGSNDIIVMTDSGAYQILEYGDIDVKPDQIIEFQIEIDSDIAIILDLPTGSEASKEEALRTALITLERGREAEARIITDKERTHRLWVLPIQGGKFTDILEDVAHKSSQLLSYDIYALGSPTGFMESYRYDIVLEMIHAVRKVLRPDSPLHLFGAGHPMIIPFVVALGVDMFDSASYLLYARDNRYMTKGGTKRLGELEYFPCSCPVCSKYSPQELKEMGTKERVRLLALHNLYKLKESLDETKQAIREGRLWELLEEYSRKHPSLKKAFRVITKKSLFIERFSPRLKGRVKAIFFYDYESLSRPEIIRHREFLARYQLLHNSLRRVFLIPGYPEEKPFTQSPITKTVIKTYSIDFTKDAILYYTPFFGIVPYEVAEVHPYAHYECCSEISEPVLNNMVETATTFLIEKLRDMDVNIMIDNKLDWSKKFADILSKKYLGDFEKKNLRLKFSNVEADANETKAS